MTYVVVVDYAVPPGRGYITKTVPISMRPMDAAHLAVIFSVASSGSGPAATRLTHVGAVVHSSGQKVSTYDRLVKIEELFPINPTPIDVGDFREFLAAEEVDRLLAARNDIQMVSEDVATALVNAISNLRPAMPPIIDWLRALEGFSGLGYSETELLWREQRDATNVGLRIGGFSATPLRAWRRPANGQPFIAGVVPYPRPDGRDERSSPADATSPSTPADPAPKRPTHSQESSASRTSRTIDVTKRPTGVGGNARNRRSTVHT